MKQVPSKQSLDIDNPYKSVPQKPPETVPNSTTNQPINYLDEEEEKEEKKTLYLGNVLDLHKNKLKAQQSNSRQAVKDHHKTNPTERKNPFDNRA